MTCENWKENGDQLQIQNSSEIKTNGIHKKTRASVKDRDDVIPAAPDGGYAWVILACSFYTSFCIEGLIGSFGLLLPSLMREFKTSAAVVSILNSTLIGIFLLLGYLSSLLIKRYETRAVIFWGACFYSLGLFCSFFAPTILVLFVTYGLLCGVGVGMIFVPSVMIVNQYFDRKRSLANGILTSGSGIGLLVMSPIIERSVEAYGWRGSLLIYSCFTLQLCVCACLMRPVKALKNQVQENNENVTEEPMSPLVMKVYEGENCNARYAFLRNRNSFIESCSTLSLPMLFGSQLSINKAKESINLRELERTETQRPETCALPHFCRSKPFIFITIGCLLTQMGQFIPLIFIGDYGNHVGVSSEEISIILSVFGVANTLGRFFAGVIANIGRFSHLTICSIGLLLSAVACFLFFLCTTFSSLLGFAITYGFFIGFFPPMQPLMIMDYLGLDQLTAGYGFVTMLKAPAAFIGPPFAGALLEMTGNYETVNGLAGIVFTLAVCAQMLALCWEPHEKKSPEDAELDV